MTRRRLALASWLLLAAVLGGCKGAHGETSAPDAAPVDAGADARPAAATVPLDAAPPDDSIPATSGDELTARARHLLEAVGKDDPDLATDILFPRDGWLATRDAADPGKEWEKRVAAPFRKSVHAAARHHEELDRAQFVSLELGHVVVQSKPRRHGWKKPLWTVKGSRLTFLVDGHTRTLTIREMTAWRGAWYVTRLR
ncbi:MAG TPA: hypothetical protein VGL81_16760 [Polyangiaceae bacterium]